MPTYIILGQYTQQGIEYIKDSPKRYETLQQLIHSIGGEVKATYYTIGRYDFVIIIECPSNEAALKALFITGSGGNARSETLVAIPVKQGIEIINALP
jgi:uncharacterized protein with GYD domain